jgi:cellulose synthase/poly-beta-1,6-N-acetylglucosamine synthase-like glycosyltransferase
MRKAQAKRVRDRTEDDAHSIVRESVTRLASTAPEFSARPVLTGKQAFVLLTLIGAFIGAYALAPKASLSAAIVTLAIFYAAGFLFKGWLAFAGAPESKVDSTPLPDSRLPLYTVLVPLYRERDVIPLLLQSLLSLDYPRHKLDVILVVEEADRETQRALARHPLPREFRIVLVPAFGPRTKPKALTVALAYARGDLVTIFDAEDQPEPDQLKRAAQQLLNEPKDVACVQARLNYFNARENWLSRQFAIDYCLWFDLLLPGLERLGAPVLLGGTSNHFRRDVLEAVGGWDPFNVTEDADLGIRLARKGFRVRTMKATTFEEAPVKFIPWLRQRTRWFKGYMQTYLVHMREPRRLFRETRLIGFATCQLFLLGTILAGILNPFLWYLFFVWLQTGEGPLSAAGGDIVLALAPISLIFGNATVIFLSMLAPLKRGWLDLVPWATFAPVYWVLISIAAWLALFELTVAPSHWAKTRHGLTRFRAMPGLSTEPKTEA